MSKGLGNTRPITFYGGIQMITIDLGEYEEYDPNTNRFTTHKGGIVRFEYSLKAVYNWEGKWKKPLLKKGAKHTGEEMLDLYHMMALDPVRKDFITPEVTELLSKYIADGGTATRFNTMGNGGGGATSKRILTAEEIYAIMFSAGIPLEFENRNLNRLLIILRIISNRNTPPKKMSRDDILRQNASLNQKRKAQLNTRG